VIVTAKTVMVAVRANDPEGDLAKQRQQPWPDGKQHSFACRHRNTSRSCGHAALFLILQPEDSYAVAFGKAGPGYPAFVGRIAANRRGIAA
jgi:hypothetical protein